MAMWNLWRGCHKISDGCVNCYIHQGDEKRNVDTNLIVQLNDINKPLEKDAKGNFKIKPGRTVYICFSSDFLIEEADQWRQKSLDIIRQRNDLNFVFLTKRIERFTTVMPSDFYDMFSHVTVGVSVSTQKEIDSKIRLLSELPIKHKNIILQPLIEDVDISVYLKDIDLVIVGGEYGKKARPLNYDWVLSVRNQCVEANVSFEFRQCATHFIKEGISYTIPYRDLSKQAKKANINYKKK